MKISAFSRLLAAACAAGVAACGSSGGHGSWYPSWLLPHRAAPAALQQAVKPSLDGDMVAAVTAGKDGNLPVRVRFALRDRPEVGQAAELDLELVPSAPLDRLVASFHAEPGLSVSGGAEPSERDRPEPGVPIPHRLTIVPQHDGIFYVDATVLADLGNESLARTFTIPVIAGAGAP